VKPLLTILILAGFVAGCAAPEGRKWFGGSPSCKDLAGICEDNCPEGFTCMSLAHDKCRCVEVTSGGDK